MLSATVLAASLLGSPAIAIQVTGTVQVDTGTGSMALARFDEVPEGARVVTYEDSFAQLRMASGSLVRLGPETEVALSKLRYQKPRGKRKESVRLVVGKVWARVTRLFGAESSFEVEAENAVAGVRGTTFFVERTGANERFTLTSGALQIRRGATLANLDEPGSFLDATASGFGAPGKLSADELTALRRSVGGSAWILNTQLALTGVELPAAAQPKGTPKQKLRRDILGPDRLVDSLLPPGGDETPASNPLAEIRVQLQIPTPGN